jgi:hypothetical protein
MANYRQGFTGRSCEKSSPNYAPGAVDDDEHRLTSVRTTPCQSLSSSLQPTTAIKPLLQQRGSWDGHEHGETTGHRKRLPGWGADSSKNRQPILTPIQVCLSSPAHSFAASSLVFASTFKWYYLIKFGQIVKQKSATGTADKLIDKNTSGLLVP